MVRQYRGVPIYYGEKQFKRSRFREVLSGGIEYIGKLKGLSLYPPFVHSIYPNFFVVGAQKCGTSTLHEQLGMHPEIFMGPIKESNFFLDDEPSPNTAEGYDVKEPETYGASDRSRRRGKTDREILRDWTRGYRGEPVLGESCPYYMCRPILGSAVPEKMYQFNPDSKLLAILRDPLDRIASSYLHDVRMAERFGRSVESYEQQEGFTRHVASRPHLVAMSKYHFQLAPFRELFPPDRIKVVLFEEYSEDPQKILGGICRFLGVDASFEFRSRGIRNQTPKELAKPDVVSWLDDSTIDDLREDAKSLHRDFGTNVSVWEDSLRRSR